METTSWSSSSLFSADLSERLSDGGCCCGGGGWPLSWTWPCPGTRRLVSSIHWRQSDTLARQSGHYHTITPVCLRLMSTSHWAHLPGSYSLQARTDRQLLQSRCLVSSNQPWYRDVTTLCLTHILATRSCCYLIYINELFRHTTWYWPEPTDCLRWTPALSS